MNEIIIRFTDPCPCGSGRVVAECCFTSRCNTVPSLPATGYSNPRCYAAMLEDCSLDISREHYISASILQQISDDGLISSSGLAGATGAEFKEVPIAALGSKVLCKRHNEALSSLDALAGKFFSFFRDQAEHLSLTLVNGDEVERWMLKLLCAYLSSGSVSFEGEKLRDWRPPGEWLQILFGSGRIQPQCGLHYLWVGQPFRTLSSGVRLNVASDPNSAAMELAILLEGVPFIFMMQPRRSVPTSELHTELWHHPREITLRNGGKTRTILTGWLEGRPVFVDVQRDMS